MYFFCQWFPLFLLCLPNKKNWTNKKILTRLCKKAKRHEHSKLSMLLVVLFSLLVTLTSAYGENPTKVKELNGDASHVTRPTSNAEFNSYDFEFSDELMLFQDIPIVISASRKEQPINQSSVPISVVTAEDIHASGLTNIYEAIQFQPGVDMLQIDRNRYALGVRGLHEAFSDRTLTLIDGRNADSTVFGGSELLRLPLFIQDIERIEVVRGPGGASWGAQAFNGVINIITKHPKDVHGMTATAEINEFGDYNTFLRWAESVNKWDWRLSLGYTEWESSEEAIKNDHFTSNDFHRNIRSDSKAIYHITEQSKLKLGLGTSHIEQGDFEVLNSTVGENSHLTTIRAFSRLDHTFEDDTFGYLQWFGNFTKSSRPRLLTNHSWENDLEAQYNFTLKDSHKMTIGGNIRFIRIDTEQKSPEDIIFQNEPLSEEWVGVFVLDRWAISKRLAFDLQIRGDYYSETHSDWSSRATSLYAIDNENHHTLRLSIARAFRAPLAALREITSKQGPLPPIPGINPPFTHAFTITPPKDLDNEGIVSLEMGYTGQLSENVFLTCNTYYQDYSDLIGFSRVAEPIPNTVFITSLDNLDDAEAVGAELEIAFKGKQGQISFWYSYNAFIPDKSRQNLRAFLPAKNKVGANGRLNLPAKCTLNLNYKYTDATPNNPGAVAIVPVHFEVSHRLDITVSKSFYKNKLEWLIGVSDLFDETDIAVFGINNFAAHETPGRTFFSRLTCRF